MNIDQSRRFTAWARNEVWTGPTGTGDYVPNPDDLIFDIPANAVYKVNNTDYTTGLTQWERFIFTSLNGATDTDVLIGVGPGSQSETWRIHASMLELPREARMDQRLVVYGTEAAYVKVFKVANYTSAGNVIGAMYDQNDQWVGDEIPVNGTGMFRTVSQFYLKEPVVNGQPLYVLIYNAAGVPISEYRFLAHVTDFIPSGNVAVKHISKISLETRYLNETNPTLVQIPKNITLASLVLYARVHYSDSSSMRYAVDGTKFTLLNAQPFIAGIEGQKIPIRLKYTLGADETGDGIFNNSGDRFITQLYEIEVMPTDISYSVKLMSFPEWVADESRYRLRSFLYFLNRTESYEVTDKIVFGVTGTPWTGSTASPLQTHVLSVDMEDINSSYSEFRYIQDTTIDLMWSGSFNGVRWTVKNGSNPGTETYSSLTATIVDNSTSWGVDITGGIGALGDWLKATYLDQGPLYTVDEGAPLAPTHVRVIYGNQTRTIEINEWNNDLTFTKAVDPQTGQLMLLEFVRDTGVTQLLLGACGLAISRV